ncbi:transposase [Sphingomonas sanguinis]|uniref:transposase n=1 Tax=Sphingomonas sanguinis TaxID=33051 RepID=UPI003A0FFEA8
MGSPTARKRAQEGGREEAIGRSHGGRTCRMRCLADDCSLLVGFALTPGNVADTNVAIPLLSVATPARHLIADKAYDADSLRRWLADRRIKAVIPSAAPRRTLYPFNKRNYRCRTGIERLFCRLENWHRIAPRGDRQPTNSLAAIHLVPASPGQKISNQPERRIK